MQVKILLLVNAVLTGMACIILIILPHLIPDTVGISIEPNQYLFSYLLAGAEGAIAYLSYRGSKAKQAEIIFLVVQTNIIFHTITLALETFAYFRGFSDAKILYNVAARLLMIGLFIYFGIIKRDEIETSLENE